MSRLSVPIRWPGLGTGPEIHHEPASGTHEPALVLGGPETRAPRLCPRRNTIQLLLPTPCLSPACSQLPSAASLESDLRLAVSALVQLPKVVTVCEKNWVTFRKGTSCTSKPRQAAPQSPSRTVLAKLLWLLLVSCLFTACRRSPASGLFLFHGGARRRGRSGKAARPGRVPPFGSGAGTLLRVFPWFAAPVPAVPPVPGNPALFLEGRRPAEGWPPPGPPQPARPATQTGLLL
jgi:hypothetical protein